MIKLLKIVGCGRALALAAMTGCRAATAEPDPSDTSAADHSEDALDGTMFFPLDGERHWVFQSPAITYRLVGHKPAVPVGGSDTYDITFTPECIGTDAPCGTDADNNGIHDFEEKPLFVWRMSSNADGTAFHALSSGTFDPPVALASTHQLESVGLVTRSGGITYTSMVAEERSCDVPYWRDSPPMGCRVFRLRDGGAMSPLAGEFMANPEVGLVWFWQGAPDADGFPARTWELVHYEYSP